LGGEPRSCDADEPNWTITGPRSVTFEWRGNAGSIRYGLTSAYGLAAMGKTNFPEITTTALSHLVESGTGVVD